MPKRYHDRRGSPFLLDRHARLGPKGKAVEFGRKEEIAPVRRVYTLADEPIFEAVLAGVVANPAARKAVTDSYRSAKREKTLTADSAAGLLETAVATMRAVSASEAQAIVERRSRIILAPGKDTPAPKHRAGARAAEKDARNAAVRRLSRHRT